MAGLIPIYAAHQRSSRRQRITGDPGETGRSPPAELHAVTVREPDDRVSDHLYFSCLRNRHGHKSRIQAYSRLKPSDHLNGARICQPLFKLKLVTDWLGRCKARVWSTRSTAES